MPDDRHGPSGYDHDPVAAALVGLWGLLATVGGSWAAISGHAHGGHLAGAGEMVYGVALLWVAWTLTRRLTWRLFLFGAPLVLVGDALDSWMYLDSRRPWPSLLTFLVVIEWLVRLLRRTWNRDRGEDTTAAGQPAARS